VLRGQTTPADPEPLLEIDAEMPFGIITPAPAEALATLEPSGPGSPEPVLLARRVEIEGARRVDPTRPHLRLRLRQDGRTLPAIGLRSGKAPAVRPGQRADVVFRTRLARWQGRERLEPEVLDRRGSSPPRAPQVTENAREFGVP